MNISTLFREAIDQKASDIHLATGETPRLRIAGDLVPLDAPALDRLALEELLAPALSAEARLRIESGLPLERIVVEGDMSFAGIFFKVGDDGLAATFRILSNPIPDLDAIGGNGLTLLRKIVETRRGLVLMVGPTASGKWTAACSLIEAINVSRAARVFVIESHPSYRFQSKKSLVTQLHVGQDFESFAGALETIHPADPDVIALNDVPTLEDLRQALVLADTGHLVLANLHADSPTDAIRRLVESANGQADFLRRALAQNLVAIVSLRLFPCADGSGRVAAFHWIATSPNVREAMLAGDLDNLERLQTSEPDSRSLDQALDELVQSGQITAEVVAAHRAAA